MKSCALKHPKTQNLHTPWWNIVGNSKQVANCLKRKFYHDVHKLMIKFTEIALATYTKLFALLLLYTRWDKLQRILNVSIWNCNTSSGITQNFPLINDWNQVKWLNHWSCRKWTFISSNNLISMLKTLSANLSYRIFNENRSISIFHINYAQLVRLGQFHPGTRTQLNLCRSFGKLSLKVSNIAIQHYQGNTIKCILCIWWRSILQHFSQVQTHHQKLVVYSVYHNNYLPLHPKFFHQHK